MKTPELQFLDVDTQEAVKRFVRHLHTGHRSAATQRMYVRCLVRWLVAPNGQRLLPARVLSMAWAEKRREIAERREARMRQS